MVLVILAQGLHLAFRCFKIIYFYPERTTETLKENVKEFSASYSDDVDGEDLYIEVCQLKQVHKANISSSDEVVKPLDLLNKLTKLKLNSLFPNICVALHIFICEK